LSRCWIRFCGAVAGRAVHRPLPRPTWGKSSVPLAAVPGSAEELPVPGVPLRGQVLRLFAALAVVVAGSLTEGLPKEDCGLPGGIEAQVQVLLKSQQKFNVSFNTSHPHGKEIIRRSDDWSISGFSHENNSSAPLIFIRNSSITQTTIDQRLAFADHSIFVQYSGSHSIDFAIAIQCTDRLIFIGQPNHLEGRNMPWDAHEEGVREEPGREP
jgi:hypothetical protein